MSGLISWKSIDGAYYERAVQALLSRLYDGARALDGSGGDGGKDTTLVTADGLTVFEMKSHTARLTNGQKRNIKSSLRRAVANAPGMTRWELVMPLNPTPRRDGVKGSEEAWFESLSDVAPGVQLEWRGLDWLDQRFAAHPDLAESVEGPTSTLLRLAGEHHLEHAALANGVQDLAERGLALQARADVLSPHWTVASHTEGNVFTSTLLAKHSRAAEVDPIRFTPSFSFSTSDPAALAKHDEFAYAVDFGDNVEIPGEYITGFEIDASPQTRRLLGPEVVPDQISFMSQRESFDPPVKGTVVVLAVAPSADSAAEPEEVARLDIYFDARTSGQRGARLFGKDRAGILFLTVDLPRPGEDGMAVHPYADKGFTMQTPETLAGFDAADLAVTLNVLRHIRPGYKLAIRISAGVRAECGEFTRMAFEQTPQWWQVAADLARFAEVNDTSYRFPDELDLDEVETLRLAGRLLDGRVSIEDPVWTLDVRSEALGDFLAQLPIEIEGGFYASSDETVMQFGNQRIPLGTLTRWAPGPLRIRNRTDLEARVAAGVPDGESLGVELQSLSTKSFWLSWQEAERLARERAAGRALPNDPASLNAKSPEPSERE